MEIIDLSKPITNGLHAHITTSIVPLLRIGDAAGKFDPPCEGFAANLVVMSDHCATHVDAPNHFIRGGASVDQISLHRMIGPAVVCDLTDGDDDQIEADLLIAAIARMPIKPKRGWFLLLHTCRQDARGKGLGRSAAEYLVELGVRLVGTDHGGIDNTRNRDRPGHMTLLQHDVLIVESLTNLDRLLGQKVLFVCLPLALQGASGSPVRPIAITPCPNADWSVVEHL